MSDKLNSLGVPPEFHAHARHFAGVFKDLGWTQTQIDEAIRFGAAFNGKPEDLLSQFDHFAEQHGVNRTNVDLAASWHEQVNEKGIENMPSVDVPSAASSGKPDAQRRAEIEEDMRKPKADSKYWHDPSLRDEYAEILERAESGTLRTGNAAPDATRKAEIESLMKSDRAAYHRTGADQEYLAILQRESGETPDGGPDSAAPQVADGGSDAQS